MALLALIIVVSAVLLVLAFLAPRWSYKPQHKVDGILEKGQQKTSKVPGKAGEAMPKPFQASEKVADKSADTGRKARDKT